MDKITELGKKPYIGKGPNGGDKAKIVNDEKYTNDDLFELQKELDFVNGILNLIEVTALAALVERCFVKEIVIS